MEKISLSYPPIGAEVFSYAVDGLDEDTLYTIAVYQNPETKPELRQLLVNIKAGSSRPLVAMQGLAPGKVHIDVYSQTSEISSNNLSVRNFSLPEFREKHNLVIEAHESVSYNKYGSGKRMGAAKRWEALSDLEKKYCRCVLSVVAKNTNSCNRSKKWDNKSKCYSPHAVCEATVKSRFEYCGLYYIWSTLSTKQLESLASLAEVNTSRSKLKADEYRSKLIDQLRAKAKF